MDHASVDSVVPDVNRITDYNAVAPHSALGFRSSVEYRSTMMVAGRTAVSD
jgi:hypothetical protein